MNNPKTIYTLSGHPVQPVNLAELFALFAATITGKGESIGLREESKLSEHGNKILKEKEDNI